VKNPPILVTLFVVLAWSCIPSRAATPKQSPSLNDLIDRAEVIVAAKIQRTDYSRTGKDGPMAGTAKVLKCIKGKFSPGDIVEFSEPGWWEPEYKSGETRILFLERQEMHSADTTNSKGIWQTAYSDSLSFLINANSLSEFSMDRVALFLKETHKIQRSKRTLSAIAQDQRKDSYVILIHLSSPDDRSIWIHRETFKASFRGKRNGKDYVFSLDFPSLGTIKTGPFIEIKAGIPLPLQIKINREQVEGLTSVQLLFKNRVLIFPNRCWSGIRSISVMPAALPSATSAANESDVEATAVAFFGRLFSDDEFVSKMKPIVDTLHFLAVADITEEMASKYEARMAKQWEEQAGPAFFQKLADAGLAKSEIRTIISKLQNRDTSQKNALADRIFCATHADAQKKISVRFILFTLSYIHGRLTAATHDTEPPESRAQRKLRGQLPSNCKAAPQYVLRYRQWSGVSPGAGSSHTSLIAVELDLSKSKMRKLWKSASRPTPMLPHDEAGTVKLLADIPWTDISKEDAVKFSSLIQAWLATKPPAAYNSPMALGREDGFLTELSVSWGTNTVATELNPRGGYSPRDPLRPSKEWRELTDALLGLK